MEDLKTENMVTKIDEVAEDTIRINRLLFS